MNEIFTIGGFCFRVIYPDDVIPPENFLKFRGGTEPVFTYSISITNRFPTLQGTVVARHNDILVCREDENECRYIGIPGNPVPYACYLETSDSSAQIYLSPDCLHLTQLDTAFTALFALERRQIGLDALILHCAFVEYRGEAILFSAPSETGKTTQANLWERYRGSRTVNGDRGLIQKLDGRWYARGWPVCGSSEVCHNRDVPIRAIVMLSQAPVDRVEKLPPIQAFTRIFSQITVNRWNREANLKAMELVERITEEIPVYHLTCTMEESAVQTLERILY